jgi:uncharacterized protein YndB with AHSA1/START domain
MNTTEITEPAVGEVTFRRIYNAPRELMFDCMTQAEHLTHFWGPVGVHTPIENITIDLRVGGVFETTMVDDSSGAEYESKGVFVVIDRPNTLAFEEPGVEGGMRTTISFVDLGDGRTEAITHQTNVPEMYRSPEARAGMTSSFDRFEAYLAGRS